MNKTLNFVVVSFFICISLGANLPAQDQSNLLTKKLGARIVEYSSNYHSEMIEDAAWDVSSLIAGVTGGPADELPVWCTGTGAPFPHFAVIELPKSTWLTTFVFNNYIFDEQSYPGISAKNIRIENSNSGAMEGFEPAASFMLERNKNDQEVCIAPHQARWVKIFITSNWGNPTWEAVADCHFRMLLSEIHCHQVVDSRLKHARMTVLSRFLVNLQQPPGRN